MPAAGVLYRLPDSMREAMREPFGPVLDGEALRARMRNRPRLLASVGDVVTATLAQMGATPDLAIVDYRTIRGPINGETKAALDGLRAERVTVANPAAVLTRELWNAVHEAYRSRSPRMIVVEGEEDLATLAAVALAPDGTTVIYGMPSRGAVWVDCTPEAKTKVLGLLARMPP